MAEIIMTFALGFLIASAVALTLAAPLWRRAASITEKRLRASSPVSLDDFNADKDRMRAEFAMSARKLEMSVDNLRKKAETRLAELDRRERQVATLKDEINQKAGVETKQNEEIAILKQRLADAESSLARRDEELTELRNRLGEAQNVLARQAVAIREANSLVEGHKSDIDVLTRDVEEKTEELTRKAAALEERDGELAKCGRAVAEQKMIVGELKRERVLHTRQIAQLEAERDAAAAAGDQLSMRADGTLKERDEALAALEAAREEIAALKAKSLELTREYQERARWERRESALLRERLGDLTVEVERASGDIDALIGGGREEAGSPHAEAGAEGAHKALIQDDGHVAGGGALSLAQRIRALGGVSTH